MQVQLLRKILHTAADKNIGCLGVMLRLANIGVSQHLCNARHRNVVQQGERSGKGVSGNMVGQLLVDTAYSGEFLQILVYLWLLHTGSNRPPVCCPRYFSRIWRGTSSKGISATTFVFWRGFLIQIFPSLAL